MLELKALCSKAQQEEIISTRLRILGNIHPLLPRLHKALEYSGNICGVDAFCINVEGSVHDCTLGQHDTETGSELKAILCQLHATGRQRTWEQWMQHGKGMQGLQDMCMQQSAGVIAPITALVLLPSLAFLLSALLCTTFHLGFAQVCLRVLQALCWEALYPCYE